MNGTWTPEACPDLLFTWSREQDGSFLAEVTWSGAPTFTPTHLVTARLSKPPNSVPFSVFEADGAPGPLLAGLLKLASDELGGDTLEVRDLSFPGGHVKQHRLFPEGGELVADLTAGSRDPDHPGGPDDPEKQPANDPAEGEPKSAPKSTRSRKKSSSSKS